MGFDVLMPEEADRYLEIAFRRARVKVEGNRVSIRKMASQQARKFNSPLNLEEGKLRAASKINIISGYLSSSFDSIMKSFPSIDNLTPFYRQLLEVSMDKGRLKKCLASLNWIAKRITKMSGEYKERIKRAKSTSQVRGIINSYYGRVKSLVDQLSDNILFLRECTRKLRKFPTIKELPTIIITGFPNIGKTTLFSKLTSSKPEINSYPFTTRRINVSYMLINKEKVQILDTPGTLARFEKMNSIEKQAWIALKTLSNIVIYVFDATEPYPLAMQLALFERIKKELSPATRLLCYMSKEDIAEKAVEQLLKGDFLPKDKGIKCTSKLQELRRLISSSISS